MQNYENNLQAVIPTTATESGATSSADVARVGRSRRTGPTGPRTVQGKKRSRRNALKHGIFSQVALFKDESRAEFNELLNGLREDLQPEGTLEEMLVEKLTINVWRHRRLFIAETAEIQSSIDVESWDEAERQAEAANYISGASARYQGGLIRRIANTEVLEACLGFLEELREGIKDRGFDPECDVDILKKLYGEASEENWRRTLFDSYLTWLVKAEFPDDECQQHEFQKPEECKEIFLKELGDEIKRLERYKKARASVESERKKLEGLRPHLPDDHLLRYEASLERTFDRTLTQLERLQRMRLGQPVPPKLEVQHSLS